MERADDTPSPFEGEAPSERSPARPGDTGGADPTRGADRTRGVEPTRGAEPTGDADRTRGSEGIRDADRAHGAECTRGAQDIRGADRIRGAESPRNLEDIVAAYADRLILGERIDAAEILARYPTHGSEILEQLEAFVRCAPQTGDGGPVETGDVRRGGWAMEGPGAERRAPDGSGVERDGPAREDLERDSPEGGTLERAGGAGRRVERDRMEAPGVRGGAVRKGAVGRGAVRRGPPGRAGAEAGGVERAGPASLGTLGDFQLRRKIGSGGMGVVYEAWQSSMDRSVALKVLPAGIAADQRTYTRFLREARAAGKLHHPSIVSVHALGVHENTPYYAMELVEGETLAQILARWGRISEEREGEGDGGGNGDGGAGGGAGGDGSERAIGERGSSGGKVERPRARGSRPKGRRWLRSSKRGRVALEEERWRRLSPILELFRKPSSGRRPGSAGLTVRFESGRDASLEGISLEPSGGEKAEEREKPGVEEAEVVEAGAVEAGPSEAPEVAGTGETSGEPDEVTAAYCYRVAEAFAEAADGLQHAHERGVVHRDIKPSNLILDTAGRLRILDFGLAHLEGQESLTHSGDIVGTILYMSPEQAMAQRIPIDHRTDLYSLGATLYETLTWGPPFQGRNYQETLSHIVLRDPEPLRRRNPRIPRDLETIVLKCLRKDPKDRYSTAEALAQDLRRFVRGDPIEARPQAALERIARRAWRQKARVAVVCLAALLLLTSGLLFYTHRQSVHAERLGLYRAKVLGAIGKMGIRGPTLEGMSGGDIVLGSVGSRLFRGVASIAHSGSTSGVECIAVISVAREGFLAPVAPLPDPLEDARKELEEAAGLLSSRPEAHFHLAVCLWLLGREEEAQAALSRALACDARFAPALILRESAGRRKLDETLERVSGALTASSAPPWALSLARAVQAVEGKRWKDAAAAYGPLVDLVAEGTEPYVGFGLSVILERGRARLEGGDQDGALEDFAMARGLWPSLEEPVLLLAKTYMLRGTPERAEERLAEFRARAMSPDAFALRVALLCQQVKEYERGLRWADKAGEGAQRECTRARLLAGLKRKEEAVLAARRAVELDPRSAVARVVLGWSLDDLGQLDEALTEFRKAIDVDPKYARAHSSLAATLLRQERLGEAIEESRVAIELDPKDAHAHSYLGWALAEQGKLDEAVATYREAIRLDPKEPALRINVGLILARHGELDDAIKEYRRAIELEPKQADAHLKLGWAFERQGKLDDAIQEYGRAIELDPKYAAAHSNLGGVFLRQGKIDDAIREYRKAIELDPKYALAYSNLGGVFLRQGKLEEAIAECRKAIELDPGSADARRLLGLVLYNRGELEVSMAEFREAIRLDPKDPMAHATLAAVLAKQKKSEEATEEVQKALDLKPKEHAHYCNLVGVLLDLGRAEEAEAACRKALELDPGCVGSRERLGKALIDQGNLEGAVAAHREWIRLDPRSATAHVNLGAALYSKGKADDAIAECREAIRLDPKLAAAHSNLGSALRQQGKLDEAVAACREAIRLDPKDALAHRNLGVTLREQGKLEDAIAEYREAIRLDPKSAPYHSTLGEALRVQGKLEDAVVEYREAIRLDPKCAKAHVNLGAALYTQEKYDQAIAEYREAIRLDPKDALAHSNFGVTLGKQGKLEDAIAECRIAVRLGPKEAPAHSNLGVLLSEQGKLEDAIAELREAIRLDPKSASAHGTLGEALHQQGNVEEAIEECRRAIQIDPRSATAHVNLGAALYQLGKLEEAMAEWRKAIELDPKVAEAHANLGLVLVEQGNLDEAVAECRKAIELDPKAAEAHANLGLVLVEQGNLDEAVAECRKARELDPELSEPVLLLGKVDLLRGDGARAESTFEEFHASRADPRKKDEFALGVAGVYQGLQMYEKVLSWAEKAAESGARERWRSEALWELGRKEDAVKAAERAVELAPGDAKAHGVLAQALQFANRAGDAEAAARRALELDPKFVPSHRLLGMVLYSQGRMEEAMAELRKAVELDPKSPESHANLGVALMKQWKLEEAMVEYRNALELDPKVAEVHDRMAVVLIRQGKLDEAIVECRKAIEIDPELAVAHANLGLALANQGNHDDAIVEYRKAIEIDPGLAEVHNALGAALFSQGKMEEAMVEFRKVLELDPKSADAHNSIAVVLIRQGKLDEAIAELRKAIELDPRASRPRSNLGGILRDQGKHAEAIRELRKAVELAPDFAEKHRQLGYALKDEGNLLEACSELRRAFLAPRDSGDGSEVGDALSSTLELLRWRRKPDLGQEMAGLIEALEALSRSASLPDGRVFQALALAYTWPGAARSPEKALEYARLAFERLGERSPGAWAFLAEVENGAGRVAEAVVSLEEASKLAGADAHHAWLLEEARKQALPAFASYESIDQVLDPASPWREILVPGGASWRFFRGRSEPSAGLEWTEASFDDSRWEEGLSGFGNDFGRNRNRDMGTTLPDIHAEYTTLYARTVLRVDAPAAFGRLRLLVYSDDGFVAYLNGKEIGRLNAGEPGTRIPFDGLPQAGSKGWLPVEIWADAKALISGENVLAVQGVNQKLSAFYLEPILEAERVPDPERPRKLLEAFRSAVETSTGATADTKGDAARALVAYMEGRILEGEKKPAEAVSRYEEAIRLDGSRPQPLLRAARILRAAGDPATAEEKLAGELKRSPDTRVLWDEWFAVSAVDLKRGAASIVSDIDEITGGAIPEGSYAADLRWALGELSGRGALRIRCGGEDFTDGSGAVWGRDRFARSGRLSAPKSEPVDGTEDDALYQGGRSFDPTSPRPHGYRIPVPPGRYRVTLGFAEVSFVEPGKRVFDVLLEGKVVQADYEPKRRKAESLSFEVAVEDGDLEIEFMTKRGNSKISAIAIEGLR